MRASSECGKEIFRRKPALVPEAGHIFASTARALRGLRRPSSGAELGLPAFARPFLHARRSPRL